MKTVKIRSTNNHKKIFIRSYTGLYPPGGFVSRPKADSTPDDDVNVTHRRSKAGGFIALPAVK